MRQLYPSSMKALDKPMRGIREAKYPWKDIKPGQSFSIDYNEIKIDSLRPFVSRMGKKLGKKFRVIDHGEKTGYEVACLPMSQAEATANSSTLMEAIDKMGGVK